MSLPSRQLFLDRFMEYNRERYKNDPETLARLQTLTLDKIVFQGLSDDPSKPGGKVSNFSVPAGAIMAELQHWNPLDIKNEKIINPAIITAVPSIEEIIAANTRGLFSFEDQGQVKLAVVMSFRQDIPTGELTKDVVKTINYSSNYILKETDLQINFADSTDDYRLFNILNETIVGEVTVIRLKRDILNGTPWLGYLGAWIPEEVIRPSILAEMVGMSANLINPDTDWLKFSIEGRIFFVAKKPVANLTSYAALSGLNLVEGNRFINIGNDQFKVKLLSGENTLASEWNRLMYRVSKNDPTKTFWETFTDEELGINVPLGARSISRSTSGSSVYARGGYGIESLQSVYKTTLAAANGWRPVLEYVGVDDFVYAPNVHMTEVVPVEPLVSGSVVGEYVYSVGPTKSVILSETWLSDYHYGDPVYTVQKLNVLFLGSGTTDVNNYHYDSVIVPLKMSVKSLAGVRATDTTGYSLREAVSSVSLGNVLNIPKLVSEDVAQLLSDTTLSTVLSRIVTPVKICSGYDNRQTSDSASPVIPISGPYILAAEFVIESIEFTGIDIWVPETDYGDLFDDPVYNPLTTFMSF